MTAEELIKYYPCCDTHGTFAEGGHKIHIKHEGTEKTLCGCEAIFTGEIPLEWPYDTLISYINQPDPDKNLCQRCRNILLSKIDK